MHPLAGQMHKSPPVAGNADPIYPWLTAARQTSSPAPGGRGLSHIGLQKTLLRGSNIALAPRSSWQGVKFQEASSGACRDENRVHDAFLFHDLRDPGGFGSPGFGSRTLTPGAAAPCPSATPGRFRARSTAGVEPVHEPGPAVPGPTATTFARTNARGGGRSRATPAAAVTATHAAAGHLPQRSADGAGHEQHSDQSVDNHPQ